MAACEEGIRRTTYSTHPFLRVSNGSHLHQTPWLPRTNISKASYVGLLLLWEGSTINPFNFALGVGLLLTGSLVQWLVLGQ